MHVLFTFSAMKEEILLENVQSGLHITLKFSSKDLSSIILKRHFCISSLSFASLVLLFNYQVRFLHGCADFIETSIHQLRALLTVQDYFFFFTCMRD